MAERSRELTVLTQRVYRSAALAIANSKNTASILQRFGVPARRIRIVYPGVDVQRFTPDIDGRSVRRQFAPKGETLILSVGRLQRRKGHDTTIRAIAALRERSVNVRYVIVGDGEDLRYLQDLASTLGVADSVVFAGEISADQLPAFYSACDVFVLANRIEQGDIEGFGIVFLEAASAGKPSIGGRSGGVPEAVADGETGLLVSGTDVPELAAAIERLAGDHTVRERMGRQGRDRARRSFTWQAAAQHMLELHGELGAS